MNILKVTLSGSGDRLQARLADGGLVPVPGVAAPVGAPELGVRPEALTVVAEGGETEGTATVVERLGERTLVHVRLRDGAQVTAQDRGISTVEPGQTVRLKFDTSALHLFGEDGRPGTRAEGLRGGAPRNTERPWTLTPCLLSGVGWRENRRARRMRQFRKGVVF